MEIRSAISRRGEKWVNVAAELYDVKQTLKELTKRDKELSDKLKEMSEYRNATGGPFLYTVTYNKGRVEYELIPELKGVDLEPYRGDQISVWKITKVGA